MKARSVVLVTIVAVVVASGGVIAFSGVPVSENITLNATDGPAVEIDFDSSGQLDTSTPFPDENTVEVRTGNGDVTFSSPGPSSVFFLDDESLTGTFTKGAIRNGSNPVTVNPEDKRAMTFEGRFGAFAFQDGTVGGPSFLEIRADGQASATIRGVGAAGEEVVAVDDQNQIVGSGTVGSNGNVEITFIAEDRVFGGIRLVKTSDPLVDDASVQLRPTANRTIGLQANVSDPDFAAFNGEQLTVEFVRDRDGAVMSSTTLQANGTAEGLFDSPQSGTNGFSVRVTDDAGASVTSQSFTFETNAPQVTGLAPNNSKVSGNQNVSAEISDADFGTTLNDTVTVEFIRERDNTVFATRQVDSNGTVKVNFEDEVNGENKYSVVATDNFAESTTASGNFTLFRGITFRPANSPDSVIQTSANVTVRFFGFDGETFATKQVRNGSIDLRQQLVEQRYFVSVSSDTFQDRSVVIDSLFEQRSVFLLSDTTDSVLVDFELDDKTSRFSEGENTQLLVERAITRNNRTSFRRVVGADIDATGSAEVLLEPGVRYRLTVRTDTESRVLGSFTTQTSQRATLEIGELEFGFDVTESFKVDANRTESDLLRASYVDPQSITDSVTLRIVNSDDSSDVLFEQTFDDQQNISVSEKLTGAAANKSFTLKYRIERGGNVQTGALPMAVGVGQQEIGIPLDSDWKGRVSIAMLLLFGSVFTAASVRVGAVAVPALGGVLLLLGWMPIGVGAAGVGAALTLGVAYSAIAGGRI